MKILGITPDNNKIIEATDGEYALILSAIESPADWFVRISNKLNELKQDKDKAYQMAEREAMAKNWTERDVYLRSACNTYQPLIELLEFVIKSRE